MCFPGYVSACVVCFVYDHVCGCLLNAFAICVGEETVFSLKDICLYLFG